MKTPFGNTVAAIKLAKMIENNKTLRKIVAGYFGDYLRMLGSTLNIHNIKSKRRALIIFRKYYFDAVENDSRIPSEIKGYLLNSMSAYHRGISIRFDSNLRQE